MCSCACSQLALANVLISPLNMLPVCITGLVEALVSVRRVQRFLAAPEVCPQLTPQHEQTVRSMPTRA